MTVRPILFSDAMVRAILEGRKTQTRRVMKPQPEAAPNGLFHVFNSAGGSLGVSEEDVPREALDYVPYEVGDLLYCREAWRCNGWATDVATIFYRASENDGYTAMCEQFPVEGKQRLRVEPRWHPSIHMPRWASRLTLAVADVRVQRLQDVTEEDAIAEGIKPQHKQSAHEGGAVLGWGYDGLDGYGEPTARLAFRTLWDSLNAKRGYGWDENPWVTAIKFAERRQNVDALLAGGATQ